MASFVKYFILVFVALLFNSCKSDTPANCTFENIRGKWLFVEGKREFNNTLDCSNFNDVDAKHVFYVTLDFPNLAFDTLGHKGFWTIIYNQGFEVVINYRKYFAFSAYKQDSQNRTINYCNQTLPGWSHDVLGNNWACYKGYKKSNQPPVEMFLENSRSNSVTDLFSPSFISEINKVQSSWSAAMYPELQNMTIHDLVRRAGGTKSRVSSVPTTTSVNRRLKKAVASLPDSFDWRNVSGINYVSPVRNQGSCGSCYAFSSLAMLESRLQIMTNNSLKVQFSPQDVVSCSEYAQGCEGGFPYVIAGKYAQDFGVLPEECYPYEGHDGKCFEKNCKRYYVADYKYVGGFFGGCNEELMKLDLVKNGPLTVAFEVYPDFMFYKSGIYHHTGINLRYNPFHEVNHGVLITGYGIDSQTGEKYWIVKNSWGTTWGEQGYFRIRRGNNECNIESMAVSAIPIP